MNYTVITGDNSEKFQPFARPFQDGENVDARTRMAFGAVDDDGTACGIMIVMIIMGYAGIDWIYVAPDYRRKGVAGGFVDFLRENAKELGIEIIFSEYCVSDRDSMFAADRLFTKRGSTLRCLRWYYFEVPFLSLIGTDLARKALRADPEKAGVVPLSRVPRAVLGTYLQSEPSLDIRRFDRSLSLAVLEDGEIKGVMLVRRSGEELISIELLEAQKGNRMKILMLLMGEYKNLLAQIAEGKVPETVRLEFGLSRKRECELPERLIGAKPSEIIDVHNVVLETSDPEG